MSLNTLQEEHFCFAFVSFYDPDSFGRITPSQKRIKKEPKIKTEIDVGTQGWQDLDVEQLLESESWRGVGRHQARGRLEEIWKRHCNKKGSFPYRRLSASMPSLPEGLKLAFFRHLSGD